MTRPLDKDDDRKRIAKDGETVRISMFAMDSLDPVQRAVALDQLARDTAILHKPGFVTKLTAADSAAKATMYDAADRRLSERWKDEPAKKPAQNHDQASPSLTSDARAAAYSAYERRLTNAWRHS